MEIRSDKARNIPRRALECVHLVDLQFQVSFAVAGTMRKIFGNVTHVALRLRAALVSQMDRRVDFAGEAAGVFERCRAIGASCRSDAD